MKVGEYARYKYEDITDIGKITFISEVMLGLDETLKIDIDNCMEEVYKNDIIKSSSNIMDLIEKFDFVNGHLVICKMYENEKDIPTIVKCVGDYYFKEEDIKSIVTKEQFERIQYNLESEVN